MKEIFNFIVRYRPRLLLRLLLGTAFVTCVLAGLLGGSEYMPACQAEELKEVIVNKEPAAISRKEFQPWNPFNSGPPIPPGQKALTQYAFNLTVRFDDIDLVDQEERHGRWFVHIRPRNALVRLTLNVTIWLPERAPKKCREHEEGHRVICEQIYTFAEDIVRHYACDVVKKEYYGEGPTSELAQQDAYKLAAAELNKAYRDTVFQYANAVSDEYDRLTEHGINELPVDAAIQQAFAKCGKEMLQKLERGSASSAGN